MKLIDYKSAKAMLKQYHHCINSSSLLPSQAYKPSSLGAYPVMWVNQVVALMMSKNYEPTILAVRWAHKSLKQLDGKPVYAQYGIVALNYLVLVSYFLKEYSGLDQEYTLQGIPPDLLNRDLVSPPKYNVQTGFFEFA